MGARGEVVQVGWLSAERARFRGWLIPGRFTDREAQGVLSTRRPSAKTDPVWGIGQRRLERFWKDVV